MKTKPGVTRIIVFALAFVLPIGFYLTYRALHGTEPLRMPGFYGPKKVVTVETQEGAKPDTVYHTVPEFEFDGHLGRKISNGDFEGSYYIANFFFTNCPGICPIMSTQMTRLQKEFEAFDNVKILSHTVDPEKDSVDALNDYAEIYGAIDYKWHFVTGDKKDLYRQARKGYFVTADEGDGGPEDFIHSEKFMLIDREGHIRGYYNGTDTLEVNNLMRDLHILIMYERKRLQKVTFGS